MSNRKLEDIDPDIAVIETAIERLKDPCKWVTRALFTGDGRNCALGHIYVALGVCPKHPTIEQMRNSTPRVHNIASKIVFYYQRDPDIAAAVIADINNNHGREAVLKLFEDGLAAWKERLQSTEFANE